MLEDKTDIDNKKHKNHHVNKKNKRKTMPVQLKT